MSEHSAFETVERLAADTSTRLNLSFGPKSLAPGDKIPKAEAKADPTLTWTATTSSPDQKYLLISLDLDAPFPSFPFLSPILHWLQSSITIDQSSHKLVLPEPSEISALCFWGPPGPPPISAPHRYIFLLYEEPKRLEIYKEKWFKPKGYGIGDRIKWDLEAFEKEAELQKPVAATWFCSN